MVQDESQTGKIAIRIEYSSYMYASVIYLGGDNIDMIRYNFLRTSFLIRGLQTNSILCKNATEAAAPKELPKINGQPTIYHKKRSMSNVDGYRKAKVDPGFYLQKAQSSPTGAIHSETIPLSFLPKDDPRRQFVVPHLRNGNKVLGDHRSPEVLTGKNALLNHVKSYHLTPEKVNEIIRLRNSDPNKYTRSVLAKQFSVSRLFISLVASAPKERLQEMNQRLNIIQSRWGKARKQARLERAKRHQTWYRDL